MRVEFLHSANANMASIKGQMTNFCTVWLLLANCLLTRWYNCMYQGEMGDVQQERNGNKIMSENWTSQPTQVWLIETLMITVIIWCQPLLKKCHRKWTNRVYLLCVACCRRCGIYLDLHKTPKKHMAGSNASIRKNKAYGRSNYTNPNHALMQW